MDFPRHSDTISTEWSFSCFKRSQVEIFKLQCNFIPEKCFFILANSEDPYEMLSYAAFHLGLHCLQKYMFTGIQNEKG